MVALRHRSRQNVDRQKNARLGSSRAFPVNEAMIPEPAREVLRAVEVAATVAGTATASPSWPEPVSREYLSPGYAASTGRR